MYFLRYVAEHPSLIMPALSGTYQCKISNSECFSSFLTCLYLQSKPVPGHSQQKRWSRRRYSFNHDQESGSKSSQVQVRWTYYHLLPDQEGISWYLSLLSDIIFSIISTEILEQLSTFLSPEKLLNVSIPRKYLIVKNIQSTLLTAIPLLNS